MPRPVIVENMNDDLDVFGQQMPFKLYTQICFCYSMPDDIPSHSTIIATLTNGLERLSASFPWLAGQVVNIAGSDQDEIEICKIRPFEKAPRLVVKDLRNDPAIPTMEALRNANFPISMLDENIIAPFNTLPEDNSEAPAPIFVLQANFIVGGLVLTIVGQHNTMDMTGQGHIISLLSKACHNEPFNNEELASGNLSRCNLIPLLDESYTPGAELAYQIVEPTPPLPSISSNNTKSPTSSKSTWAYFTFPSTSLISLKALASSTLPPSTSYITTDDALSAFIWQSITRARLARLNPTTTSTLARAVDVRSYLNIPAIYPGMMQNMTYQTHTLSDLLSSSLGSIASSLRSAISPKTSSLSHSTRALATALSRLTTTREKNLISLTATIDPSTDIMLSSWAKLSYCHFLDFNLGVGKPVAVLRPGFTPVESLVYLMPRTPDGEIRVAICLSDEDMGCLRADGKFSKYGRYVG